MKQLAFNLFFILIIFLGFSTPVFSQYGQYGQPSPSYAIIVDKFVGKPIGEEKVEYVDNLSFSEYRFSPRDFVYFKVIVKNTSTVGLSDLKFVEHLPPYVHFVSGPGVYDKNTNSIYFTIPFLEPDETKTFYFSFRIFSQDELPKDKGVVCMTNKARVEIGNVSDEDSSQFCVEKVVLGVEKVPKAGAELALFFIASFGIGLAGIGFRKRMI